MRIILLALSSLAVLAPVAAQTGLGIVRGTALDPTGSIGADRIGKVTRVPVGP